MLSLSKELCSMRIAAVLLLAAATAWCVPVEKWVQTTRSDFQNGKAQGTAVLAVGKVTLAPELKPLLGKAVPHIWALAADGRGAIYAATGLKARVIRIRGGKADDFFTAPNKADLEILSVAVGPKGAIYAAAAPSGTLYRIAADGKADVLYKSPDPYVWALAIADDGTVYAATGPNGKLLKITPKGKATTVLKADAKHILSLLLAPDGSLYAGTDRKGLLYHVPPKGTPRVVYDAAESDIRALARDPKGNLYFATAATATKPTTTSIARKTPSMMRIVRPSSRTPTPPPPTKPSAPGAAIKATNSIYRLAPDGAVTKLLSTSGVAYYALIWHRDRLYAGTGNAGKLYRIDDRASVQLADLKQSQIMALAADRGALVLATANDGQVYRVAAQHATMGTLLSEVYDTTSLSRWGQIAWQAQTPRGAGVTLATRSGNTSRADASWSPWSKECTEARGQAVASPPARFIQYRATLKRGRDDKAPLLDEVVIAYVRANEPPRVTRISVGKPPKPRRPTTPSKPGTATPTSTGSRSRPMNTRKQSVTSQRGPFAERIRITWAATDPNKDSLLFALHFRGEDESTWKKIRDRLLITHYDWDTERVPDGAYRFRVVASDIRTNPPDRALEGELVGEAVVIDNTPPTVGELKARVGKDRAVSVAVAAKDAGSRIDSAEYTIDGGEWQQLAPTDGIFDAAAETMEFKTESLEPGEHTIVVRAKDEAGNSGAAKAVIQVK